MCAAVTSNLALLSSNHLTEARSPWAIMKYNSDSPSYRPIVACQKDMVGPEITEFENDSFAA